MNTVNPLIKLVNSNDIFLNCILVKNKTQLSSFTKVTTKVTKSYFSNSVYFSSSYVGETDEAIWTENAIITRI